MPDTPVMKLNYGKESLVPVYNQEIADLLETCDDAVRQITACPSAHKRNWQEADLKIIRHIHTTLQANMDDFKADPEQYVPNADKTEMNTSPPPDIEQPENLGALIIARQIAKLRMQLRNGSSAEQVTGFHPKEYEYSIIPLMTKLDKYIAFQEQSYTQEDVDYYPDVRDQEPNETTPGSPDGD